LRNTVELEKRTMERTLERSAMRLLRWFRVVYDPNASKEDFGEAQEELLAMAMHNDHANIRARAAAALVGEWRDFFHAEKIRAVHSLESAHQLVVMEFKNLLPARTRAVEQQCDRLQLEYPVELIDYELHECPEGGSCWRVAVRASRNVVDLARERIRAAIERDGDTMAA
jgi:hypothetical protein